MTIRGSGSERNIYGSRTLPATDCGPKMPFSMISAGIGKLIKLCSFYDILFLGEKKRSCRGSLRSRRLPSQERPENTHYKNIGWFLNLWGHRRFREGSLNRNGICHELLGFFEKIFINKFFAETEFIRKE